MNFRIIKSSAISTPRPWRTVIERTTLMRQAEVQAQERAGQIVSAAAQEAELIIRQATEKSAALVQAAKMAGEAEASAKWLKLQRQIEEKAAAQEKDLEVLAVKIAEKIIGEQLTLTPQMVVSIVEKCLQTARGNRTLRILVHAEDAPFLQTRLTQWMESLEVANIVIENSEQLARGNCIVQTDLGEVDGRIATQLQTMLEALTRE